ncbi:MAG: hypothetical protein WCK35_24280 [Chloroflexota bacterium]
MISENKNPKRYFYSHYAVFDSRSQRRLRFGLGFNLAAAESILHLRCQVVELNKRLHQMEIELADQMDSQQLRLAPYLEIYDEAVWISLVELE